MAAALAAEGEVARQLGIEEDHGLGRHHAVLGGAEAQHVDARLPRQLGRRAADIGHGVGEARAVHVQFQPMAMRRGGDRRDLLGRIDGAAFGRLGDADGGGLGEMRHAIDRLGQRLGELHRIDLALGAVDAEQTRAPGVELGRAGFLGGDVGRRMAEDRAPRRGAAGQRQAVGGGAGDDREGREVGLVEQLAQAALDALGPVVGAVGEGAAAREGAAHRLDDRRMGADLVVAAEVHAESSGRRVTASRRLPSGSRTNAA